jgi:uncharacterized membrane protein
MQTGLYFALNKHYLQALSIFEFLSLAIILAGSSCPQNLPYHVNPSANQWASSKVYWQTLQLALTFVLVLRLSMAITPSGDWLRLCYTFLYNNSLIPWRPQN